MNKTTLSEDQLERLAALDALPDDRIDTTDIPEAPHENARLARRPGQGETLAHPDAVALDADVVGWFKEHAGGKPYQTEINRVLRQYVAKAEKKRA
ncbi:BrnA antitoxin family protein [Caulobacter hibisci]|uniref:BrnA antitoxin family protein n=1 Tax=Caulobacter hibisci TaxID=2035993 RepID=A0ABS0T0R6_9CAUL|nr:BrnA antitoxin family protein [Caulobacter hibisci]MBI1685289.1 BrnA antitoxin family protein [Caulobacter hibisci]